MENFGSVKSTDLRMKEWCDSVFDLTLCFGDGGEAAHILKSELNQ